jgi:predicted transposase YbfD/YdcC
VAVDVKPNEITALPTLLQVLALKGCSVTIDAMGCQRAIAKTILDQGGDYVLALKANQPTLHAAVATYFARARASAFRDVAHGDERTVNGGHGRVEIRQHWTVADPAVLATLDPKGAWAGLASVGMVERERHVGPKTTCEGHSYLSSLDRDAATFARAVRDHWASRTAFIGCWTSPFGKTTAECGRAMRRGISPSCAILPSTCCARTTRSRPASRPSASRPNASRPAGTKPTSSRCSMDKMRLPCLGEFLTLPIDVVSPPDLYPRTFAFARAHGLVTGDNDLLSLQDDPRLGELEIVTPRAF